jgi:hypothetical protein
MIRWAVPRQVIFAVVVLVAIAAGGRTFAQDGATIDGVAFWANLNTSDNLLDRAMTHDNTRRSTLQQHNNLWQTVRFVRLDGRTIQIDASWLILPLSASDEAISRLDGRVEAVINDHAMRQFARPSQADLNTLHDILNHEPFRSASGDEPFPISDREFEPAPRESTSSSSSGRGGTFEGISALAQVILAVLAILVSAAILYFIIRNLKRQSASVELDINDSEDIEPVSAAQASTLAVQSETIHDYRTAIRFLYLSSLLDLDERGIIHYDATQTNQEHLRQLTTQPTRFDLLWFIVNTFDEVWYGFKPADERLYRQFRQHVEQLKQSVL